MGFAIRKEKFDTLRTLYAVETSADKSTGGIKLSTKFDQFLPHAKGASEIKGPTSIISICEKL